MKTELNINKLIEEAQTLCHDGMIEIAAMGQRNVQVMESENGNKYQMTVALTMITEKQDVIKSVCDKHDWQLIAPNSSRCRKCGAV